MFWSIIWLLPWSVFYRILQSVSVKHRESMQEIIKHEQTLNMFTQKKISNQKSHWKGNRPHTSTRVITRSRSYGREWAERKRAKFVTRFRELRDQRRNRVLSFPDSVRYQSHFSRGAQGLLSRDDILPFGDFSRMEDQIQRNGVRTVSRKSRVPLYRVWLHYPRDDNIFSLSTRVSKVILRILLKRFCYRRSLILYEVWEEIRLDIISGF